MVSSEWKVKPATKSFSNYSNNMVKILKNTFTTTTMKSKDKLCLTMHFNIKNSCINCLNKLEHIFSFRFSNKSGPISSQTKSSFLSMLLPCTRQRHWLTSVTLSLWLDAQKRHRFSDSPKTEISKKIKPEVGLEVKYLSQLKSKKQIFISRIQARLIRCFLRP